MATEVLFQAVEQLELEVDYMPPISVKTKNVKSSIISYAV